jgi:hypothetical protein
MLVEFLYLAFAFVVVIYLVLVLLRRSSVRLKNVESKFYNFLIRFPYHAGGFDAALSFPKKIKKEIKHKKGLLQVDYEVPTSICIEDASGKHVLALGGVLALGDSLTTFVMMAGDSLHRPGVSVSLAGNMLDTTASGASEDNTVFAGDVISIVCRTTKVGATVGFSEAFFSKRGRVLAHVRHIKYLKMGYLFDNWVGPLLPLYFDVSSMMSGGTLRPSKEAAIKKLTADCEVSLESSLSLSRTASASAGLSGHFGSVVHKGVENPFGNMHGGAVACLANDAALQALQGGQVAAKGAALVTAMEISFLSPAKGKLDVSVQPVMSAGCGGAFVHAPSAALDADVASAFEAELRGCESCLLEDLVAGKDQSKRHDMEAKTRVSDVAPASAAKGVCSSVVLHVALKKAASGSDSSPKRGKQDAEKVYADCKVTVSTRR